MNNKALNKQNLERSKKILLNIADYPTSPKFYNLSKQELERAKILRTENKTSSQKFHRYKRGTIVFIHFGTNIGNELSNSHFGIVLDKKDHPYNGKLTVLPLTSKNSKDTVSIDKAVFSGIMAETEDNIKAIKEILELTNELEFLTHVLPGNPNYFSPTEKAKNYQLWMDYYRRHDPEEKHVPVSTETVKKWIQSDLDKITALKEKYANYDKVSYIKIDSITSVSKLRIAKPINDLDPIGKIVLSKETMELIDKEIAKKLLSGKWSKMIDK